MTEQGTRRGVVTIRYAVTAATVALVYLGAAKLGLSLAFTTRQVTAVWPPSGIALAALLLFGARIWPGVFLGAFIANATHGEPPWTAAGISVGNTLGPIIGALLLRHLAKLDNALTRLRDVLGLLVAGAAAMTVSATNGVANLALGGIIPWAAFGSVWWVWWVGDAMGVLLFAPFLLTWAADPRPRWKGWRPAEAAALFVGLAVASRFIFLGALPYQVQYAVFPFLIWAALRFGMRETATAVVIVSGIAVWGAIHERGPFAAGSPDERLILMEAFMAVAAVAALAMSAVTAERGRAEEALLGAHDQLEGRVRERTAELAAILDAIPDLMFRLSADGVHLDFRAHSTNELYVPPEKIIGGNVRDLLPPAQAEEYLGRIRAALATGSMQRWEYQLQMPGGPQDYEARMVPSGPASVLAIVRNISENKRAEQAVRDALRERERVVQKELLLKEIHHRVKNNLQVISSLLKLQAMHLEDQAARDALAESESRLQSIALVHEKLYQSTDVTHLEFDAYASVLVESLAHAHAAAQRRISAAVDVERLVLAVDTAIPCGLILNELVTNALKHAFPGGRAGSVRVAMRRTDSAHVELQVSDDGVGLPAGLDPRKAPSLGLGLVFTLADQLDAEVDVRRERGTAFHIRFARGEA